MPWSRVPCVCGQPKSYAAKHCRVCRLRHLQDPSLSIGQKRCKSCQSVKPLDQFAIDSRRRDGYQVWCKQCFAKHYRSTGGKAQRKHTFGKYGITVADFIAMWTSQQGVCAACGDPLDRTSSNTHIDHCHVTGRVRGILCRACNHALGNVKDSIERLEGLVRYLRRSPPDPL